MENNIQKLVAKTFGELADALESGSYGKKPKIAVTGPGSEHGEQNVLDGAVAAAREGIDITYIGSLSHPELTSVYAEDEASAHAAMEKLLGSGEVDGAVTMHYPFPIGVATVGLAVTPAKGKEMFIACTTGTADTDRATAMVRGAVYGIIAAKACGNPAPTVGILNTDGAVRAEGMLKELAKAGYDINFAESARADGGAVLRGNDLLTGSADIAVTDSLTGNILVKMLSSFNTGGVYEATGSGYGPGIGEGYDPLVMIVSRASGSAVIAGAARYAAKLVRGNYREIADGEFRALSAAGYDKIIAAKKAKSAQPDAPAFAVPKKEVVTGQIAGVEITELEDAVICLHREGIYAESGMGCTGPIVMVAEHNIQKAAEILVKNGYMTA